MSFTRNRLARTLAIAVLGLALLIPAVAVAKSYSISSINIGAAVDPNGDMRVTEDRTLDFNGSFHWAQWQMLEKGADRLEITSVSSLQGGTEQPYTLANDPATDPGTYSVKDEGDSLVVRAAFDVTDAKLPLQITYTAKGAAKRYTDTAELYWQFIGSGTDVPSGPVHIEISPPVALTKEQVKAWAHGPLTGTVTIADDGKVTLDVPSVPANTFVEARVLYPPTALPDAPIIPEDRLQAVLSEEATLANQANAERNRARLGIIAGIGLSGLVSVLAFAFALWAFLKHGREYKPEFHGGYVREDPRPDLPPAVIGAVWRMSKVTDADAAATLMDLADKGVIAMRPITEHSDGFLGIGAKDEQTFELGLNPTPRAGTVGISDRMLLDFLFDEIGDGQRVRIDDIKVYAKDKPSTFTTKMQAWKDECSKMAEQEGMFEGPSWSWQIGVFVLAVVVVAVGFFSAIWGQSAWPVCLAVPSAVAIAVFGVYMLRRSPKGNELYAQYRGLRDFLRDFSRLDEAPPQSIVLWNRFLVLAVVFGIGQEVISQLRVKAPEIVGDPGFQTTYWWVYSGTGGSSPVSSLQSGFASAAQIATSAQSSASGGGGGFSGGGGGGGGGGGFSAG